MGVSLPSPALPRPNVEEILLIGRLPGVPRVVLHHRPVLSVERATPAHAQLRDGCFEADSTRPTSSSSKF